MRWESRRTRPDEIRIALQRWADRVEEIAGGEPGKVVTLRERRGGRR